NVLKIKDGKLTGYNTDIFGFEKSLLDFLAASGLTLSPAHPLTALILGTGGASKAVAHVLKKLGIAFQFASRSKKEGVITYEELSPEILAAHRLVVNTTPLGTFPNVEEYPPLPYDFVNETHLFYDLVYNPEKTSFLKKAEARHARICNGLKMLHLQAEKAWEIWNQG
ncbi:MAG: shikimate dehydrogenase, partial [Bacteroidota bacterium]